MDLDSKLQVCVRRPVAPPVRLRSSGARAAVVAIVWQIAAIAFAAGPPSASGTWTGTLNLGGGDRPILVQIEERENQRLLGYVLGGTESRTVVDGARRGRKVTLSIELRDPLGAKELAIAGRLRGDAIEGWADDGAGAQPVTLRRTAVVLHERRFIFAEPSATGGEPSQVQVAAVFDGDGSLVSGAYVGVRDCHVWGCSGAVTSFSEGGSRLEVGLEGDDGCSTGASVDLTFDGSSKLYTGTYSFTDCRGTTTGVVLAGRTTRTRSDDSGQILRALGRLADDFEARRDFGETHPSFSASYRHYGRSLADVLAGFNEERAAHRRIEATFNRFQLINTVDDPDTFPQARLLPGAVFAELRRDVTRPRRPDTYVDTHARPGDLPFAAWALEGSRWVIKGNQADALQLPFDYTLGAGHLVVPTPGDPLYVSLGPYGAHFSPLSGHAQGDAKGNLMGFFTRTRAELTELAGGDGDGQCEAGERCGFFGGPDGSGLRDRVPAYVAPLDGTVAGIRYTPPNGLYLDNAPKWEVEVELHPGHRLRFDHLGRIAPSLQDKVLAAAGTDTDTYTGPAGDLTGVAGIPVSAGEALAFPQILARPVTGYPGYYAGDPDGIGEPFVQMEFALIGPGFVDKVCVYAHLPGPVRSSLQAVLDAEMADPLAQRFALTPRAWEWSAEGRLCMAYSPQPQDFSRLFTNLGGWFEADKPGSPPDEIVAFVPIATDTASYDPFLYEPTTRMLIARRRAFGFPFSWSLPGSTPTDVFYPAGEVVESTDATLLIKWRTTGLADIAVFQRAAYVLDRSGLKIAWGPFAPTAVAATLPAVSSSTPCDDTDVICYDHQSRDGF
jgi:hypothetical protein